MGKTSIEWTHYSFNPWHGCVKVSPGCRHCYAETLDRRFNRAVWGPAKTTPRMGMSDAYWQQPHRWNKVAAQVGERQRVFCASMADVFEDHPGVVEWRERLWELIEATPWLDWLLLTKRPENIAQMLPAAWLETPRGNVWLGTSVEDQQRADERIPHLLKVPAVVRFLSCEPLLAKLDLSAYLLHCEWCGGSAYEPHDCYNPTGIDWIICGGESGPKARPMHPDWARSLRDQARAAGVAFFLKQWGQYAPVEFANGDVAYQNTGKHAAGRLLDDRTWDEFPVGEVVR